MDENKEILLTKYYTQASYYNSHCKAKAKQRKVEALDCSRGFRAAAAGQKPNAIVWLREFLTASQFIRSIDIKNLDKYSSRVHYIYQLVHQVVRIKAV